MGPPNGSAKLISLQVIRLSQDGIFSIEVSIADELKYVSMEFVGSGARDDVDGSAGCGDIASTIGAGDNLEFLRSIRVRKWAAND